MLLLLAFRNLLQHRRRTSLLVLAISAVTLLLVLLLALTSSIFATMRESATTLVSGDVTVRGFYKPSAGQSAAIIGDTDRVETLIRRQVPDVDHLSRRFRGWARLVSDKTSVELALVGLDFATDTSLQGRVSLLGGSLAQLRRPNTILMFDELARKLDVSVGDTLTLSMPTVTGTSNSVDVQVGAIAHGMGLVSQELAVVDNETLRYLYQARPGSTSSIHVYLRHPEQLSQVQESLRRDLAAAGFRMLEPDPEPFFMKYEPINQEDWTGQKLDVGTWQDEIFVARWTLPVLHAVSFGLTFILLVVIAVGIANALWTSLQERTRELGTMRALGMRRWRLVVMVVLEGCLLGAFGTALGAGGGTALCAIINHAQLSVPLAVQVIVMRQTLHLGVTFADLATAMSVITTATTLVAVLPSLRAARMKPITAMHHIG